MNIIFINLSVIVLSIFVSCTMPTQGKIEKESKGTALEISKITHGDTYDVEEGISDEDLNKALDDLDAPEAVKETLKSPAVQNIAEGIFQGVAPMLESCGGDTYPVGVRDDGEVICSSALDAANINPEDAYAACEVGKYITNIDDDGNITCKDIPGFRIFQSLLNLDAILDVRVCVKKCGNGYDEKIGGWSDTNDIDDIAYDEGCTGELENRGEKKEKTYFCAKTMFGKKLNIENTVVKGARFCVNSCGNGYDTVAGGWKDGNDIDDIAYDSGCEGRIKNRGKGNKYTYLCLKRREFDGSKKGVLSKMKLCMGTCGIGFSKVGGWQDTNDIDDIAYGPFCLGKIRDWGRGIGLTKLCVKSH